MLCLLHQVQVSESHRELRELRAALQVFQKEKEQLQAEKEQLQAEKQVGV